jgi:hypothetical protein
VDWHLKNLQFETPEHKALECETLVKNMENLKQKEYLDGTNGLDAPSLYLLEQKFS